MQLLPPLSTEEYEALKADIERNGVLHPIIVDEEGNVLDGNHRLQIDPDAPKQVVTGLTELEKVAYAYRANLARRNLSPEQRKEVDKDMKDVALTLKKENKTQKEIGELLGVAQQTVSDWLNGNMRDTGNGKMHISFNSSQKITKQQKETIYDLHENGNYTQEQLASDYKVNQSTISRIIKQIEKKRAKEQAVDLPDIELPAEGEWQKLGSHLLYCGDTSEPEFWRNLPQASFAFADPPYNADVAEWDTDFEWQHDWLTQKASIVYVTPGIESIQSFLRVTNMPYVWSMATWIKNGMTRGKLGFGNWIYGAIFSTEESIYRNAQDHLAVTIKTSETDETNHKGRKPLEMLIKLIELFTEPGDIIIDPFLGSGTTLFAAEQLGRVCIGGEINQEFCKKIVERYGKNQIRT